MQESENLVRLIGALGEQLGIMSISKARLVAKGNQLDLFLIQPDANPPVARIMDLGRFKFEQQKRLQVVNKKRTASILKEIKLRINIAEHDYQVKLKRASAFLNEGNKIKVLLVMRGREVQKSYLARTLLSRFASDLVHEAAIEYGPIWEGKCGLMILLPK